MKVSDLKKYKTNLYGSLSRDLSDFEKNFLLISSGILAFSVTFIKEVVRVEDAQMLLSLFASWVLFAFSVGIMMITFLLSASFSDLLWREVDNFMLTTGKLNEDDLLSDSEAMSIKQTTNSILFKSKSILRRLRYTSVILFIGGVFSLAFFVGYNLYFENQQKLETPKNHNVKIELNDIKLEIEDFSNMIIKDSTITLKK